MFVKDEFIINEDIILIKNDFSKSKSEVKTWNMSE